MIRKALIVVLTLASTGTIAAWVASYAVWDRNPGGHTASYRYGFAFRFVQPTDPASTRLYVSVERGTLHLHHWQYEAPSTPPSSRRWKQLGFSFLTQPYTGRKPPHSFWKLEIPLWCPMALFVPYPAIAFIRGPLRRWRRRRKGLCLACGYDLTGNMSGVCPECGTQIKKP